MSSLHKLCVCLLNISEARKAEVVARVADAALKPFRRKTPTDAAVLNVFSDYDYNRSVITIAANSDNIVPSVVSASEEAFNSIDLRQHDGGHPRLGAVDLIPIHPVSPELTLPECGELAKRIASQLAESVHGASFFLFGHSDSQCRGLVHRRREVQWFRGRAAFMPGKYDIGLAPSRRYGLTGCGAIPYVMNCNVTIETTDIQLGRNIAADIRATSNNGLRGVQSMAFPHGGCVEIACNVEAFYIGDNDSKIDGYVCSFGQCYHVPASMIQERVRTLAAEHGVATRPAAIVGFSPQSAREAAIDALKNGTIDRWRNRNKTMM